jgi:hypothetical protein
MGWAMEKENATIRQNNVRSVRFEACDSSASSPHLRLVSIKLLHTIIWAFFAGAILALPIAGLSHRFDLVIAMTALVAVECIVLLVNRLHCPLTDLAGRFTANRADNFDIYLPIWLARHNKTIFGTLFLLGEVVALWSWLSTRVAARF